MATGVARSAAPSESPSAAAMRASADKTKGLVLLRHAPLVRGHLVDRLVERPARLPAGQLSQRVRVRSTPPELLEAAARERDDRHLLRRSDVEHSAAAAIRLRQEQQTVDGVADMQKAPHLRAVAVNRQIVAGERLPYEARD